MGYQTEQPRHLLAFDTANEVVAIGLGRLDETVDGVPGASGASGMLGASAVLDTSTSRRGPHSFVVKGVGTQESCGPDALRASSSEKSSESVCMAGLSVEALRAARVEVVATREVAARRASNTVLLAEVDTLLDQAGVRRENLAALVCGRGPGSFTGVRICMATAKGAASALEVPLLGVSTLDAVAWGAWERGVRGRVLVAADAMRKEVYPALFDVDEAGVERLTSDTVVKAATAGEWLASALGSLCCARPSNAGARVAANADTLLIIGDALAKYTDIFSSLGTLGPQELWVPSGRGLLLAPRMGDGDPATLLPVYTRLSDAEEGERARLSKPDPKNLRTGVQAEGSLTYRPLEVARAHDVAALEARVMGSDAWGVPLVADELPRKDRTWWAAYDGLRLVGYCGGWVVDGQVQVLKIATDPAYRRRGIARELLGLVAADARNLGATEMTLEVRSSNTDAQAFYERMGLVALGVRPRYYSDREDAVIMTGSLPVPQRGVAGMRLSVDDAASAAAKGAASQGTAWVSARDAGGGGEEESSLPEGSLEGIDGATAAVDVAPGASGEGVSGGCGASGEVKPGEATPGGCGGCARPLILALESSCDETAASIIDGEGTILSDVVASQVDFHARFGGVVPEIASRKHIEAICGVCNECLDAASRSLAIRSASPVEEGGAYGDSRTREDHRRLRWRDMDAVAVTYAPGLVGALVVGVAFAKGAAWGARKPLIAVNHLEGHIYANRIARPDIAPPLVVSLVSGGHTLLVHVRAWGDYVTLGSTIDDAVGEAFDKVAKALGLGYPGGPAISRFAAQGNPRAIDFPRALLHSGDLRFSLSGLKTAVTNYIYKEQAAGRALNMPDIAASFTAAVVDVQVAKARAALIETGAKEFCLGGGVAANPNLRAAYERMCADLGVRLTLPPLAVCGDQAAMIAAVAHDRYAQERFAHLDLDVQAHAPLDEPY